LWYRLVIGGLVPMGDLNALLVAIQPDRFLVMIIHHVCP